MSEGSTSELAATLACPEVDLLRSPAALRVGQLAAESKLFMTNYEHRVQLPTPDHWNPSDREDLGIVSRWQQGVLPESKYAVFRHDLMLGSMHPMHRGKWTAHELCHGLVGFAWKPKADILFHSAAARLAEILPVALWYFFDEEGLSRCPMHRNSGPLGREFCRACEFAAGQPGVQKNSGEWIEKGVDFVQAELAAVRESVRTGNVVTTPHDVVDLSADSVSYALAHAPRLASEEFEVFVRLFFNQTGGHHETLESLESRVTEVLEGIVSGKDVVSYASSRWNWVAQDVGWRLLTIASECSDEVRNEIVGVVSELSGAAPKPESVMSALRSYEDIVSEFEMPAPVEVFSVGYSLPLGYGLSMRQICEGIISACPGTSQLLDWRGDDLVASFLVSDKPSRQPIGRRFASYLRHVGYSELATLAEFESALIYPPLADNRWARPTEAGSPELLQLSETVELISADFDFIRLIDVLRQGRPGQPVRIDTRVAIGRGDSNDSFIAEMPPELFYELQSLQDGARVRNELHITQHELATLKECQLVEEI